ncbi:putative 2-dehydropantoate 2-reductase [Psilocybe cubensis]|uniref:2-dehydropantoate 2-reductase n=2 Tax=Psilocybe cubensis TaxID=181762 RepID=A0ACB8HF07_PSICU|nr:putative 2-dehydropantoate 2-reductase [Psilocybe cubensis]KAH9486488.1 putative 2-dehydropantoate 2-reductase [Psilocybe cubensis]
MHIHILGMGPVGCLLAHHIRQILPRSHIISLIHKTHAHRLEYMKRGSLEVERMGVVSRTNKFLHEDFMESPNLPPHPAASQYLSPLLRTPIESLFVAIKAQHTVSAIQALVPRLSPSSTIVLMQNGMGIYERLVHEVFRNPAQRPHFILASNTHGAFMTDPYHVIHAGVGSIEFGIPPARGRNYEAGLQDTELPKEERRLRLSDITRPTDPDFEQYKSLREAVAVLLLTKSLNVSWRPFSELDLAMKRKVVVNAVLNPLTSIMGCKNGDLFAHKPAIDLLEQVCNEASSVFLAQHTLESGQQMQAEGINFTEHDIPPLSKSLSSESLKNDVLQVAALTRGNISSMLQDIRRGRETEIEYINGYLESLGRQLDVETPTISLLRKLVELKLVLPEESTI